MLDSEITPRRLAEIGEQARRVLEGRQEKREAGWKSWAGDGLVEALETCAAARTLIEAEQAKILPLIESASNEIERKAREYQCDFIAWHLARAAELAQARIEHFDALKDFEGERARCAADSLYWFKYYAWVVDPRSYTPVNTFPLVPFEYQERFVGWLEDSTYVKRTSGLCEKTREAGATELFLRWSVWNWLYRKQFSALLSSEIEDKVDSKDDKNSLFEKIRSQLRLLPDWMMPKGFNVNRDMRFMNISNPENGAQLTGTAPTPNMGRQPRTTVVLCDEFAFWAGGGYQQDTSLSLTSPSIFKVSSVCGRFNRFYDERHSGACNLFEMDWRDHPLKDSRWYDSLPFGYIQKQLTSEEIAQEVDRNYDASQPGKVLKNVREEYCFITWDEMIAAFGEKQSKQFYMGDGGYKIPDVWNWGRISDYGESAKTENDTHIWAYSLMARPPQSWPLNDSLFFFYCLPVEPIGATELEAFKFYSQLERDVGVRGPKDFTRRPSVNDMSHEATDPKEVLLTKCGDNWNIPDLDFDKGRRKLVFHFEIIDKHLPNPVRPVLTGRCRIYFVALPGEYFLAKNERNDSYFVTPSQTQKGFKRLRLEIPAWHYPPEERGKPVPKMRPKGVFDDCITTVRYGVARWGVPAAPLTLAERVQEKLKDAVKDSAIQETEDAQKRAMLLQSQFIAKSRIERDMMRPKGRSPLKRYEWETKR